MVYKPKKGLPDCRLCYVGHTRIRNTRTREDGAVYRMRYCHACGGHFATVEMMAPVESSASLASILGQIEEACTKAVRLAAEAEFYLQPHERE